MTYTDKERLDWLENQRNATHDTLYLLSLNCKSIREVIDKEMEKTKSLLPQE